MSDSKTDEEILRANFEPLDADDSITAPAKTVRPIVQDPKQGTYFLNKFLDGDTSDTDQDSAPGAENPTTADTPDMPPPASKGELEARVTACLREIFDPEIPVNIFDLGLIYEVQIGDDWSATVIMTLTTPHCPVAESMPGEVELRVNSVPGVNGARVELVWDPPWDMTRMSDEARLELGLL